MPFRAARSGVTTCALLIMIVLFMSDTFASLNSIVRAPRPLSFATSADVKRPATMFTIHNLHFHGRFHGHYVESLGLPRAAYDSHGLEFYGSASFLKSALYYSDRLTTVSPTYATELTRPEYGYGLDGVWNDDVHHALRVAAVGGTRPDMGENEKVRFG